MLTLEGKKKNIVIHPPCQYLPCVHCLVGSSQQAFKEDSIILIPEVLKDKLSHIKIFKSLFEQKSFQIGQQPV